jgi:hypothetical protein
MTPTYTCECGNQSNNRNYHKSQQHIKSKTHQKYIQSNQEEKQIQSIPDSPIAIAPNRPVHESMDEEFKHIIHEITEPVIQPSINHYYNERSMQSDQNIQELTERDYDIDKWNIHNIWKSTLKYEHDEITDEYKCSCGFISDRKRFFQDRHLRSKKHLIAMWEYCSKKLDTFLEFIYSDDFERLRNIIINNQTKPYSNPYSNGYDKYVNEIDINGVKLYYSNGYDVDFNYWRCQCGWGTLVAKNNHIFRVMNNQTLDTCMSSNYLYEPNLVDMIGSYLPTDYRYITIDKHIREYHKTDINTIRLEIARSNCITHDMYEVLEIYDKKFKPCKEIHNSKYFDRMYEFNINSLHLMCIIWSYDDRH